jgi:gamma-tubulin complex component 2
MDGIPSFLSSFLWQVTQLLPVCVSAIRVRTFIRQQSKYEYGLVSHAFCAAVKKICREFDVLVAQIEQLYLDNKLSLQKMVPATF